MVVAAVAVAAWVVTVAAVYYQPEVAHRWRRRRAERRDAKSMRSFASWRRAL